jgi:hypothetical protein
VTEPYVRQFETVGGNGAGRRTVVVASGAARCHGPIRDRGIPELTGRGVALYSRCRQLRRRRLPSRRARSAHPVGAAAVPVRPTRNGPNSSS